MSASQFSIHLSKQHQCEAADLNAASQAHETLDSNIYNHAHLSAPLSDLSDTYKPSIFSEISQMISEDFVESINKSVFSGILELKADPMLSEAQLDRSFGVFSKIYKLILSKYDQVINLVMSELDDNQEKNKIEKEKTLSSLGKLSCIFDNYDTKYKQIQKFKKMPSFVDSETVILGVRPDAILKKKKTIKIMKKCSFEYVSIVNTIKSLLNSDPILNEIKQFRNENEIEPVFFAHHPFWSSQNTLRLVLFHDEFEPKNALSDIKTLYKLDMFYFTILNLSRKHSSSLKNIFLVASIYSEDESHFNINAVLAKISADIAFLEKDGIVINGEKFFGSIAQTSGDNLGKLFFLKNKIKTS
jgi:hypothetical protein